MGQPLCTPQQLRAQSERNYNPLQSLQHSICRELSLCVNMWSPAGGKMAIVNLQKTPKDKKAALVVHARSDQVMQRLMEGLGVAVQVGAH